jgi:hypothetical protein
MARKGPPESEWLAVSALPCKRYKLNSNCIGTDIRYPTLNATIGSDRGKPTRKQSPVQRPRAPLNRARFSQFVLWMSVLVWVVYGVVSGFGEWKIAVGFGLAVSLGLVLLEGWVRLPE